MNFVPAGSENDLLFVHKPADTTQTRPDNDFDDCLIVNNRESNSTPLRPRRIQIKTTLAPFLRKDSGDNIRHSVPAFIFEKKSFVRGNCIDKFLDMACCSEYIEVFRAQKVQINQLLRMTESDFEKLGIENLGDRRRLIDFIKEFHRKPWSNVPMEPFSSVVEAVRLISNLHAELSSMESGLMHFRRSVVSEERANFVRGEDPNEKLNCEKLKSEMEFCQLAVRNLSDELNRTFELICMAISDRSTRKQRKETETNGGSYKTFAIVALSSAIVVSVAFFGMNLFRG